MRKIYPRIVEKMGGCDDNGFGCSGAADDGLDEAHTVGWAVSTRSWAMLLYHFDYQVRIWFFVWIWSWGGNGEKELGDNENSFSFALFRDFIHRILLTGFSCVWKRLNIRLEETLKNRWYLKNRHSSYIHVSREYGADRGQTFAWNFQRRVEIFYSNMMITDTISIS